MSLDKNLSKIENYNPPLARKIREYEFPPSVKLQFIDAQSGNVNLLYNEIEVHSNQNPEHEANLELAKIKHRGENSIIVLIGLGLGYLFKALYDNTKSKIVIYEPNLNILRLTMEAVDFSTELSDDRIIITNSFPEFTGALSKIYGYKDNIEFVHTPSALHLYAKEIQQINEQGAVINDMLISNFNTLFTNSPIWFSSSLNNLDLLKKHPNLGILENKFKNKPAIIVSPGPSLDKTIETIKQNRDKVIVFCANVAYKTLKKHDITPDFVVIIDYMQTPAYRLYNEDISNSAVIAQTFTGHFSYNSNAYEKFVFYSQNDLFSRWMAEICNFPIEDYESKGTVSYCALFSAYKMGCNPIIMTGQDLAFAKGEQYSKDSLYGKVFDEAEAENLENSKFPGYTKTVFEKIFQDKTKMSETTNLLEVKGQNGEMLTTSRDYSNFIQYFEQFASNIRYENIKLINCSPDGAQINGFENRDIANVFADLPMLDLNIKQQVQEIVSKVKNPITEHSKEIDEKIENIKDLLKKYLPHLKIGVENAQLMLKETQKLHANTNKISKLTKEILNLYQSLNENIFYKNHFLISMCWKELIEFANLIDNLPQDITIKTFENIAQQGLNLFSTCEKRFKKTINL